MAAAAREAIALQQQVQSAGGAPPIGHGATVRPAPTPPPTPVPAAPGSWAATPQLTPASAPPAAQPTHASAQAQAPPPAAPPPAAPPSRSGSGGRSIAVIALVALGALAVVAVLLLTSGGKDKNPTAATAGNKATPAEPPGDKLKARSGRCRPIA
jgi:hypothetical protein